MWLFNPYTINIALFGKSSKNFGKFLKFFQKVLRKRGMADRIAWIHGISLPERKEKQPCENMAGNYNSLLVKA